MNPDYETLIHGLEAQRNAALNDVLRLQMHLAAAQRRIAELEAGAVNAPKKKDAKK